ncbi:hypothetical protein SAMN06265795_101196 [Noviherbaspirillum humi]|uniref:Uncharacterized protein n=1 Tax=Noviherbaspirillum humi TaxID=1688639 RepID=A0A239C0C2_9BURK|nr:hypothetical protein SAMN06265795_101196 [Noviherbaspirillum humi]
MRKMILMAVAGFVWKKLQARLLAGKARAPARTPARTRSW